MRTRPGTTIHRSIASLLILLALNGCDRASGELAYSPPFGPIEFAIGTDGHISVRLSPHLVTPIGTFAITGSVSTRVEPREEGTLLVIRHQIGGEWYESRYLLAVDGEIVVLIDGHIQQQITDKVVTIAVVEGVGRVTVVHPDSKEAQTPETVPDMVTAPSFGDPGDDLYGPDLGSSHRYGSGLGDPVATGCYYQDAGMVSAVTIYDDWGNPLMEVQNWYSGGCQTNWAYATTYVPVAVVLEIGAVEGGQRDCVPLNCRSMELTPFAYMWTDMTDGRVLTRACGTAVSGYDLRAYRGCADA